MEVDGVSVPDEAGDCLECVVLHGLKWSDVGYTSDGGPDCVGILLYMAGDGLVGGGKGFL